MRIRLPLASLAALLALASGCAGGGDQARPAPRAPATAIPRASAGEGELQQWPEFGLNPQRSDSSEAASGITAAELGHMNRRVLHLPGTVDSSPVYLHDAHVEGGLHDAIFVTTTYGRTLAIDANSGMTLWTYTPPGYSSWAGTPQITTASPLLDPDGSWLYATSPNGFVHKLSLADGHEAPGWPVRVTLDPRHEKLGAALNIDGGDLLVATGGYIGDIPPYQGHLVLVSRASGHIEGVFNTLCSQRRALQQTDSCPASDSAILARSGAVVEPGGGRVLFATGNGPWNGTSDFGDSVLELTFPALSLRQEFTPTDQARLNADDEDLGSSGPVLLGEDRVVIAGKDGVVRVLALSRLDGHSPPEPHPRPLGGEVQSLALPGGGELFTAPAVWRHDGRTTVFLADEHATAALVLRGGRLYETWQNANPGTSPVMVGGLVYVYDPAAGGIYVYRPGSGRAIAHLPGAPGHWNSPIVLDGHIVEPEGNANSHSLSGTLEIFSAP